MDKELWVDVEATGLSSTKHGIFELACIIVIDNEVKEEVLFKMCPTGKGATKQALEITGYTIKQIRALPPWEEVYPEVIKLLSKYVDKFNKEEKFTIAGQNIGYDSRMLEGFFKAQGDNYLYSYIDSKQVIDTLPLAKELQRKGLMPKLENNKLGTLCAYFGIDLTNAHSAMCDVKATRELYLKMVELVEGN